VGINKRQEYNEVIAKEIPAYAGMFDIVCDGMP
jgi:hypothetical protein